MAQKVEEIKVKDTEILQKDEEMRQNREDIRLNCKDIRHKDEVARQSDKRTQQSQSGATKVEPHLLHPRAKLHWKKCADLPVAMSRPQCLLVNGKVYVGGGNALDDDDDNKVFEYSPRGDEWASLPDSAVAAFAMGQFQGCLITVGGFNDDGASGRVYQYKKESRQWREFLKPLNTARASLSIFTTDSAIVACGGIVDSEPEAEMCATVEVYTCETDLWHTTDPLPFKCSVMTSITIADTLYLLGGTDESGETVKSVLFASVPSLISKVVSCPQQPTASSQHGGASCASEWKTLPDSPALFSTAASLGGCLLALGGFTEKEEDKKAEAQSAIHVFFPPTNAWVKLTSGELPKPLSGLTAVQLSDSELLICCGLDGSGDEVSDVYIGSTTLADY